MDRPLVLSVALGCLALLLTVSVGAQEPTLSGKWSASAMRIQWNIGDWGEACGPKPSGGGTGSGTVTITQKGNELNINGLGRNYSTTQCWEQFPGLTRRGHSGGKRAWSNTCATAAGDPRQATIKTSLSATDTTISFDETGQYQFVIKGQNCTASVRRTRSFSLLHREGTALAPPATATAHTPKTIGIPPSEPTRGAVSNRCKELGPAARLEVSPARKLVRAGETTTFSSQILDGKGCVIQKAPTWEIVDGEDVSGLLGPGEVRIKADSKEREVALTATASGQTVRVVIEVATQERYDSLLAQRGFNEDGESTETASALIASGSISAKSTVSASDRNKKRTWWLAGIGTSALIFGISGLIFFMARRKRALRKLGEARAAAEEQIPRTSPTRARKKLCPMCGKESPAEAEFCGTDGATLVPMN